jgi:hypothetical protein
MWAFAAFLLFLQTTATSKDGGPVVEYKIGPLILVGAVLAVLGLLFWLMLSYSNRVAQTGPLGVQVKEALYTLREQQIVKALSEKWDQKAYHQDTVNDQVWLAANPVDEVPETLKGDYAVETARRQALERGLVGTFLPGFGTSDQKSEHIEQRSQYIGRLRKWEDTVNQEARQRYRKEEHDLLSKARLETGNKAFDAFDFASLWGQGPEFILQFTAVVTIIFAVIALGVLQQIGRDQAGTILAAVAGYVLGQATARSPRSSNTPPARLPAAHSGERL